MTITGFLAEHDQAVQSSSVILSCVLHLYVGQALVGPLKVTKEVRVVLGRFSCRGFRLLDQIYITYQQCENQSAKYPFQGPHWGYESH